MCKKIFALCLSLAILVCITPTMSFAAGTTETVYLELDSFEKATQNQLDKMIKSPAISASVNTDPAFIPQGSASSIKVHYDHTKLEGWGQLLGFENDTSVLLDPVLASQSLEGYEGLRFWVSISGNEWGNGFDNLEFMVGDWSWGYRTYFCKNIAIDTKGYTGYIDVKFSELTDFYGTGTTVTPNNIDYFGFKLTKTNGCYLTVDMYISDVKAYKTVTLADKAALNTAIATAEGLKEADYRPRTWAPFAAALNTAKSAAAEHYISQADVDKALADLQTATSNLGLKADKTALNNKVAEAEALKQSDYLAASWTALQTAVTQAKTVLQDADAEGNTIDSAMDSLEVALEALVKKPDKTDLNAAIDAAALLNKDDYDQTSWNTFAAALAEAKALKDDPEATAEQVEKAMNTLKDALEALVEKTEPTTPVPPTGSNQTPVLIALLLSSIGLITLIVCKRRKAKTDISLN